MKLKRDNLIKNKGINAKFFNSFANRNSFYFKTKLTSYNNKLRDLKTIQLIPSFNYFFLKPTYGNLSTSSTANKVY